MKVLFVGNRPFVLEELLRLGYSDLEVGVVAGTHLEGSSVLDDVPHTLVHSAADVHQMIRGSEADLFVSNGLPYILDFSVLPEKRYVNVHPSFLPDLRGIDPVLGAILFERDAGATCHLMDEGIDTGPIISRVKIPFSEDLHASLLYQLSFIAEARAFREAHARNFEAAGIVEDLEGTIYFSRKADTRVLPLSSSTHEVLKVISAFDNRNQGARFYVGEREYVCHSGWLSTNSFLEEIFETAKTNTVVMIYEDTCVVRRKEGFLFLSELQDREYLAVGNVVSGR